MPEIVFKGKEYVYNHHLGVPYRPLVPDAAKSVGEPNLAGNLIVHGDNLHALKSLLPRYAGQVDLIFIDPPYNTGNEGWCYSDNVNSPIMREWLSTNPVDGDDMLRHDKWLCMMWPRLTLLRELLSERGSIWITLDDNEVHRTRMVLDELFGADFQVASGPLERELRPEAMGQVSARSQVPSPDVEWPAGIAPYAPQESMRSGEAVAPSAVAARRLLADALRRSGWRSSLPQRDS